MKNLHRGGKFEDLKMKILDRNHREKQNVAMIGTGCSTEFRDLERGRMIETETTANFQIFKLPNFQIIKLSNYQIV